MNIEIARLVLAGDVLLAPVLEEHPGDGGALSAAAGGWMPTPQPSIGDRFVEVNWLVGNDWLTLDLNGTHATDGSGAEWLVEAIHGDRRNARSQTKHEIIGWGALDQPFPAEVVERMRDWLVAHALPQAPVFVSRWSSLVANARRCVAESADSPSEHERRWSRIHAQREREQVL